MSTPRERLITEEDEQSVATKETSNLESKGLESEKDESAMQGKALLDETALLESMTLSDEQLIN